ncbi:FAR1-related protein, partial [Striga asiatica]
IVSQIFMDTVSKIKLIQYWKFSRVSNAGEIGSGDVRVEISTDMPPRFVPNCKPELKPFIGQHFSSLDDAYEFYRQYAAECGFDIRRSTKKKSSDGFLIRSYILCSREGQKNYSREHTDGDSDSIKKRRRVSKRINCEAKLILKFAGQKGNENTTTCTCKKFTRIGRLCSHILFVFKDLKLESIPEKYIVSRWTKHASLKPIFVVDGEVIDQCVAIEDRKSITNQIFSEFYSCIGMVEGNIELMNGFLTCLKDQKEMIVSVQGKQSDPGMKKCLFEKYYGAPLPSEVEVLPPAPVKNKGSGSRLKSRKEKAIERSKKPLRMCSKCKQKSSHDARNCDKFAS